jgi:hypothetical protein
MNAIEELLWRSGSGSGLEYGSGDPLQQPRDTPPHQQRLALTSPTSGSRSVGIARLQSLVFGIIPVNPAVF